MTLLAEIITGATDGSTDIGTLLRKLKVLTTRLKTEQLGEWVRLEQSGYPDDAIQDLPPYRAAKGTHVKGHFLLPYTQNAVELDIAPSAFPEELRDSSLFRLEFLQAAPTLESTLRHAGPSDAGTPQIPWSADNVRRTNYLMTSGKVKLYTNAWLISAWRPVMPAQLEEIVNAVRDRVLDLALQLEELEPNAGALDTTIPAPALVPIINDFFGDFVAVAQAPGSAATVNVRNGDEAGLMAALKQAGLTADHLQALSDALEQDRQSNGGTDPATPGNRVRSWMNAAAGGAGQVAAGGLGNVISALVLAYFGLS